MQAGRSERIVHEATLDGAVLEEPFLKEGRGSAFEGRANTLVVLRATERGLGLLRRKVEQLVGRGFHAIDVVLDGVGDRLASPDEAWLGVRQAVQYCEQFAAFLVVSDAAAAVRAALEKAAARDGKAIRFEVLADRRAVEAALRRHEQGDAAPLDVGSGEEGLGQSADETVDPNDWGWAPTTDEAAAPAKALPEVDVAELLLQADELAGLRDRVGQLLKKGRKYLTLRMHFKRDRRMSEADLAALVGARDALAKAGGQLVLASLQEDVAKWLKLLDEDRHFVIADSADAAEVAHRRHAAGEAPAAPAAASDEAAFVVASADAARIVVRPRGGTGGPRAVTAPLRVVALSKEGLPHLGARLERIAKDGVLDLAVDVGAFASIRGERFDAVPAAVERARARGARVAFANASREVKALLKILGLDLALVGESLEAAALALAAARHAAAPFDELRLDVGREALAGEPPHDPVSSIELEDEPAPGPALAAEAEALKAQLAAAKAEGKRLEGEAATARRGLDEARRQADEARRQADEARRQAETSGKAAAEAAKARDAAARERDQARSRVAELELVAQQEERELAEAGAAAARVAELEAQLRDREHRAASAQKALETLQDRAQELEAAAYELPQVKQLLAQRDAALAERDQAVARLERELADARRTWSEAGESRSREDEERATAAEAAASAAEQRAQAAEQKARTAEQRATAAEQRATAAEQRATAAEQRATAAEQKGKAGDGAAAAAEQKVRAAEQKAQAAEQKAQAAEQKARALEGDLARARSAAPAGPAGGADELRRRVAELEREKAQILTEAEQEIARLTREQGQLREELESAGDMIERLGKELELS